jgi:hypothetical protein
VEYQVDYRSNQAGGGADKQLVADGGPGASDAAQRAEERREYGVNYRFNQAGGGADKQLVADGGPGTCAAAQQVEERLHRRRGKKLLAKQQRQRTPPALPLGFKIALQLHSSNLHGRRQRFGGPKRHLPFFPSTAKQQRL